MGTFNAAKAAKKNLKRSKKSLAKAQKSHANAHDGQKRARAKSQT